MSRAHSTIPPRSGQAPLSRGARLHAFCLIATAAAIPVGEGLALGLLAALVLMLVVRRREVDSRVLRTYPAAPVLVGLGVWLAAGYVALAAAHEGWAKPGEIGRWVPLLAMPIVMLSATCLPERTLRLAGAAFLAALTVACILGIIQYFGNVRPGEFLLRQSGAAASQSLVPGTTDRTVAGGFFYHRLRMAHVTVVGLCIMVARQVFAAMSLKRRALELIVAALMAGAFLLTFTRGALFAFGAGCLACLPFAARRLQLGALAGFLALVITIAAVPALRGRVHSAGSEETASTRSLVWSQGARIIADHPFGVGLGNYSAVVSRYYDAVDPGFPVRTYPHSIWLAAWAETGPVGLAAYLSVYATLLLMCIRALRRRRDAQGRAAAAAGLCGVVVFLVIGMTHDVLFHNSVALAFAGLFGVVMVLGRDDDERGAGAHAEDSSGAAGTTVATS